MGDRWTASKRTSRSPASRASLFHAVFIRSPLVESTGNVEVIAVHEGHPVAVRQDNILALCFHPELTKDLRLHRLFLKSAVPVTS